MPTLRRTVSTTCPPDEAFAYLLDFENAREWESATVECRRESGDGGPGTRYLNRSRFMGNEVELTYTVERVDDSSFVIVGKNKTTTSRDTITVSPEGAGSRVEYVAEFDFTGPAKFLGPLMRLPLEKLGNDTATSLQDALNSR